MPITTFPNWTGIFIISLHLFLNKECKYVELDVNFLPQHESKIMTFSIWRKTNAIYSCKECCLTFKFKRSIQQHKVSTHSGVRVRYYCDKCGFEARWEDWLNQHNSSEHRGIRYDCDQCDYQAKQKRSVKLHQELKHEGITKQQKMFI